MNFIPAIFAALGALLALLGSRTHRTVAYFGPGAGWIGLVGGALALSQGWMSGVGAAVGVAAAAGIASVPVTLDAADVRRRAVAVGVAPGLALAAASLFLTALTTPGTWDRGVILLAAQWGALATALTMGLVAAAIARPTPRSRDDEGGASATDTSLGAAGGLAGASLFAAVGVLGYLRAGMPDVFYGLPLDSGGESVVWHIPTSVGIEQAVELVVHHPANVIAILVAVGAIGALVAGILRDFAERPKAARVVWGVTASLALATLIVLIYQVVSGVELPSDAPYIERARSILAGRGAPMEAVQQGGFAPDGGTFGVSLPGILPDLGLLVVATILGGFGAFASVTSDEVADAASEPDRFPANYARDFMVRSVMFIWLGWIVAQLVHWRFLGVPGLASPSEWIGAAVSVGATAVLMLAWSLPRRRIAQKFRATAPGWIVAMLVIGAAVAWGFQAPFQMSLPY